MPPGQTFSKEDIIQAAMELLQAKGLSSLTARGVARKLGSSVAPVYKQFGSMDMLQEEISRRVLEMLVGYARREWTKHSFLNMGVGTAMFAVDYPNLYRALFLDRERLQGVVHEYSRELQGDMSEHKNFNALPEKIRNDLLETMWMVTHGLASMIAVGMSDKSDLQAILQYLGRTGGAIITGAFIEAGMSIEEAFQMTQKEGDLE